MSTTGPKLWLIWVLIKLCIMIGSLNIPGYSIPVSSIGSQKHGEHEIRRMSNAFCRNTIIWGSLMTRTIKLIWLPQKIWSLKGPTGRIISIVWSGRPLMGWIGIMWTYWYQEISMMISWYSSRELNKTLIWGENCSSINWWW